MIAYKIVHKDDKGRYWSMSYKALQNWATEYKVNEFVRPVLGKLFVFDSLAAARNWTADPLCEIWEVEVPDLQEPKFRLMVGNNTFKRVKSFWESEQPFKGTNSYFMDDICSALHDGVRWTDAVKLIKKVPSYNT